MSKTNIKIKIQVWVSIVSGIKSQNIIKNEKIIPRSQNVRRSNNRLIFERQNQETGGGSLNCLTQIEHFDENSSEKEKERLKKANPFTIIDYIKSSIRILIDLNVQEKLQGREKETEGNMRSFNFDEDQTNEYEKLLRKLEADIRTYIKVKYVLFRLNIN